MKRILFILLFLPLCAQAQIITTVAGCNTGGSCPLGDGGLATTANINTGGKIVTDAFGNFYIDGRGQARIRKISAVTGIITTVGGNGIGGFTGDGGPATAARIGAPIYIAIDTANNLYLCEDSYHRIRKIDAATGIINTIAGNGVATYSGDGGPASAASFKGPSGVAIDLNGNIYVEDSNRIRKIDAVTGAITHYAGIGSMGFSGDGGPALSSQFYGGNGMCIDAYGNLYFTDQYRIRKINASGIITTVAGDGISGYGGDGIPATATEINPADVATDLSGNLYIDDESSHRIRMVDVAGIIHTVAGNGTGGFMGDGGPATAAEIYQPEAIAIGRCDGNLYIDDFRNQRIRKVAFTSSSPSCNCVPTTTITVTPNDTVCAGIYVTFFSVIASGGVTNTYQWYVNGFVVSAAGNTYTYTYTPANGDSVRCVVTTSGGVCGSPVTISSNTINMVVYPAPSAISGNTTVCINSTTTLSSAPGGGTWSSGNTSVATVTPGPAGGGVVTGVATGLATVTYTQAGGCITTTTVTVNPPPSSITGNLQVCAGAITPLSDATSGGVWSSSNTAIATINGSGVVTGVAVGNAVISYSIGSCVAIATVTVDPSPSAIAGAANICAGSATTLSSAPGGGMWSSSNTAAATIIPTGAGSGTVSGLASGATVITYSLPGGCFVTKVVNVTGITPPITGVLHVCTGQSITLSDAAAGGLWSSGSTGIATIHPVTGVVGGVSVGSAVITYSLGGACITIATVTVDLSPAAGTITGPSDLCTGTSITLNNTVSGGLWSSLSPWIATVTPGPTGGGVITGISAGTDTILYTVSNASCTAVANKVITIYPVPNAGVINGPSVLCKGATTTLADTAAGGAWSSLFPSIATITVTGIVTGISEGIDTIKYTVSNLGCSATVSKLITVYDLPDAGTITGQAKVCIGAVFTLHDPVTGGVWSSSNHTAATIDSNTGIIHVLAQDTATISYTTGPNAGGCYGVATFTVTVTAQATFTISGAVTQPSCYGDTNGSIAVTISGGIPPLQYLWSTGSTASSITGLAPGPYILNVHEPATQCIAADSFQVMQPDSLLLTTVVKNDLCGAGTGSISVDIAGGTAPYSYLWSTNATGKEITGLNAGIYSVAVTDMNSCIKNLSAAVLEDTCSDIVIHDVITPNGDGINDTWVIEGLSLYPNNTVQLFDKWGDMVYEKANYKNDWSGRGKSGLLPDGTYYYLVKLNAQNLKGGENTFTGTLLIKR